MFRVSPFLIVLLVASGCNNEQNKTVELKPVESRHNKEFNQSLDSVLNTYYALSEAFVNWDSVLVTRHAKELLTRLNSSQLNRSATQSAGEAMKALDLSKKEVSAIIYNSTLDEKRHKLDAVSQNLFNFLQAIQYDQNKIYLQECTMPFNDTGRAVWLSKTEDKRNPYLGLYHPYYKAGMLECGTLESTIDLTSKDK